MLKVIISGALGKMGKAVEEAARKDGNMKIVAGVDIVYEKAEFPIYDDINRVEENADVIIDFSNPDNLQNLCSYAIKHKIAMVIGTTGISEKDRLALQEAAKTVPLIASYNLHIGTYVFVTLVKQAAKLLPDFDIEIVERHHNQKIDAPSGTALMIADAVKEIRDDAVYVYNRADKIAKRGRNEIGISAVRAGNTIGQHTVILGGEDEIIELRSLITSRRVLSLGAIQCAKFIVEQNPGYYTLFDYVDYLDKKS